MYVLQLVTDESSREYIFHSISLSEILIVFVYTRVNFITNHYPLEMINFMKLIVCFNMYKISMLYIIVRFNAPYTSLNFIL